MLEPISINNTRVIKNYLNNDRNFVCYAKSTRVEIIYVNKISEVPIDIGIIDNAKFSCDQ